MSKEIKFIENLEMDGAVKRLFDVYKNWRKELIKDVGDYTETDLQFMFTLQNMARLELNIERVCSMREKLQS